MEKQRRPVCVQYISTVVVAYTPGSENKYTVKVYFMVYVSCHTLTIFIILIKLIKIDLFRDGEAVIDKYNATGRVSHCTKLEAR